jgi:hypothetical protein
LKVAIKEKSTGLVAYVLVEDDAEVLKRANKKLDELLQCFWVCFWGALLIWTTTH